MLKNITKDKDQKGFTIIEVLIVLAIAGLILLIVFLAVPALQRNARNTAAKNDVQNVLGGIGEFEGANSGALPTGVSGTGTITYAGTAPTTINVQGSTVVTTATAAPSAAPAQGTVVVVLKAKCSGNAAITASSRAVAAFYSVETATGLIEQCVES